MSSFEKELTGTFYVRDSFEIPKTLLKKSSIFSRAANVLFRRRASGDSLY